MSAQVAGTPSPSGRLSHYLAPVTLMVLVAAVIGVIATVPGGPRPHHHPAAAGHTAVRRLPPYWIVRPGDTLSQISVKTGLTVDQLEAFNPQADPNNLLPGQRLNLWPHPPVPRRPPPGPMFWMVRPGQSFGFIATKTGINIIRLEQLNPQLKPSSLQPGDRVRLRP